MRSTRASSALLLVFATVMGGLREFLFLNLNYQLDAVARDRPFSYAHSVFQGWTAGMDLADLTRLKWALALVFTAVMWSLTVGMGRLRTGDHRHTPVISALFVGMGTLALVLHLTHQPALQAVSIKLLHALQYPVLLFIGWAASRLGGPSKG
jgi:hypothetical protein